MTDPAYHRLKLRSLLFFAPAVVGVLALLALVSWKQGLLTPTSPLYFMANSATGLTGGMPVKLNGFVVGHVASVELLPPSTQSDQRVRVTMDIARRYLPYIPKTTHARLAQEGMVGQPLVELVPQRYDARSIHAGELLPFERGRGLAEIAAGLEGKVGPVLDNTRALTASLVDPQGNFQAMIASGNAAAAELARTNLEAQATLAETRRAIAVLSAGASAPLARSDRVLAGVEQDMPQLMATLQEAAGNARDAARDVSAMTARTSGTLPAILDDAGQAASEGRAMVDALGQSWPMRKLREAPEPGLAPIDSLEGVDLPAQAGP